MNIAILANRFTRTGGGGVENYLREISTRLVEIGHMVKVFARRWPENDDKVFAPGVDVCLFDYKQPGGISLLNKPGNMVVQLEKWLSSHLAEFEPDLMLCRFSSMGLAASKVNLHTSLFFIPPAIEVLQKSYGDWNFSLKERFFKWWWKSSEDSIYRELLTRCTKVMTFSSMMKDQLSKRYDICGDKMFVNPPGVNQDRFFPSNEAFSVADTDKARLPVILYAGRYTGEKGILPIVEYLANQKTPRKWRLLLVGNGPLKSKIEELSRKIHFPVELVNFSPNVEEYYRKANVFILPSLYESFGQVITEAMACGLPVIARTGHTEKVMTATDEIIENTTSGILIPNDREDAFVEAIDSLANDEEKRIAMGKRGLAIANEKFTWGRHISSLLNSL